LGECEFANMYGGKVDTTLRAGGDERDFFLDLKVDDCWRRFPIDVKTTSYSGRDINLSVPVRSIKPRMIYIGAWYCKERDDVELRCWEWGRSLIDANQIKVWNERGVPNYTKLHESCRPLTELEARMRVLPPKPYSGNHHCHCGEYGTRTTMHGPEATWVWFCQEHSGWMS